MVMLTSAPADQWIETPVAAPTWRADGASRHRALRRADLACIRHRGLTEWLVSEHIFVQPRPCTLEEQPGLTTLSTAVSAELASLTGLSLTSFVLHEHVGRIHAIVIHAPASRPVRDPSPRSRAPASPTESSLPIAHPPLPWIIGAPAGLHELLALQRALVKNVGTLLRYRGTWPGTATPAALSDVLLQGGALDLSMEETAYWLLLLHMLEGHYAHAFCACRGL